MNVQMITVIVVKYNSISTNRILMIMELVIVLVTTLKAFVVVIVVGVLVFGIIIMGIIVSSKSKVGDHSKGWPESSLFNSYYTKV